MRPMVCARAAAVDPPQHNPHEIKQINSKYKRGGSARSGAVLFRAAYEALLIFLLKMSAIVLLAVAAAIFFTKLVMSRITVQIRKPARRNSTKPPSPQILETAPGPFPWPVIGSLHLLGKKESPFQSFTELAKEYGDIYSIKLGATPCVVVNNLDLIKEVLNQNGKFFGGRPDFLRYHKLFAGDRNNSLALCDWSNLQLRRRNLARRHCGPRSHTTNYSRMGEVANFEAMELVNTLRQHAAIAKGNPIKMKQFLMSSAMNMFSHYMCSKRFDEADSDYRKVVDHFDDIFWEINQGYAVDFLPWLAPFYDTHMKKIAGWSQDIRSFILSRIISEREDHDSEKENDFLDGLLQVLKEDQSVSRDTIIFMLEDFLGGHSSVGNLVMLTLAAVARDPEIGRRVRDEIEQLTKGKREVRLEDRERLPYTEATILECLRYASSPIVPHVATENVAVAGYGIEKGTVVFINNYELNTGEQYWDEPEKYNPSRFLEQTKLNGRRKSEDSGMESEGEGVIRDDLGKPVLSVKKNIPHFLPFSIGKRTCIGQILVKSMSFVMFANIIQEFDVAADNLKELRQRPACIALPRDTFGLKLISRRQ